jgi:O-antigen ligase
MFSSPDKFFLGVTPVYVRKGMAEYGGLTRDMPDAHNGILQVGASLGVPAMILFIVFEVMIIIRCIRLLRVAEIRKSANTWVIVPVIFSIMMMDLTEVRTFAIYRAVLLLFYLFAGWAVYLDKRRRKKRVNYPNR